MRIPGKEAGSLMVDWYLNRALSNFRAEVNARWLNRDKTSDGTVGDLAHQATSSDHNPDPDGSVDAWDMDVDGVDVWACIRAALAHESIQYVIYNREITSRSWGLGTWRTYDGANPHDKHVHFNTRASYENSAAPWLPGEDDDMTPEQLLDALDSKRGRSILGQAVADASMPATESMTRRGIPASTLRNTVQLAAIYARDAQLTTAAHDGRDLVDEPAIVAGVLAGLTPQDIAAAIPQDIARQVADMLAARLAA